MARPGEKKVLVVDDDPDIVYYLSAALEDAGFRVEVAFSVDEALERVKAGRPDFVSLDLVMPKKSGIVLFHELRRHPAWHRIPVLFVTGKASEEPIRRDLDAALAESSMSGPSTYLEKPVTAVKYVRAVAAILQVELPEGEAAAAPASPGDVRSELKTLIDGADPDALRQALELLKKGLAR